MHDGALRYARRVTLVMSRSAADPRPRRKHAATRLIERANRQGARALYRDPRFYEQLYKRRTQDVRFYTELAQRYGGGPVLELGAGSGRIAGALAQAGIEVVGVDFLPEMLARARERVAQLPRAARERVTLLRCDMRRLALGRRFPLVIAPFNAFTHLFTRRDLELTLAACRRHLRRDGRLAFDVVMPDLRALTQAPDRLYRCRPVLDPADGRRHPYAEASHYAPLQQVRTVTMVMEREDGSAQRAIPLAQRQFFPAELEALLHYNGFAVERRFGDFAFGPLGDDSDVQAIVARPRPHR
jgi:SAM-dependent methyltransferase